MLLIIRFANGSQSFHILEDSVYPIIIQHVDRSPNFSIVLFANFHLESGGRLHILFFVGVEEMALFSIIIGLAFVLSVCTILSDTPFIFGVHAGEDSKIIPCSTRSFESAGCRTLQCCCQIEISGLYVVGIG